jgi:hypothetical protein
MSMVKRLGCLCAVTCALVIGSSRPALAQQTLNFSFGYFTVRGEDARAEGDILNRNRADGDFALVFDIDDFNGATVGGEWLVPLGNFFEAGAGVSFSRRTVPTVYRRLVNRDNSEIEQNLRLRLIPIAFTVRVLPLGQSTGVQPYFGGGLAVVNWRYSEFGDFVDPRDSSIFTDQFAATGNQTGPVALAGIRFAGDVIAAGAEVRYQSAVANLSPTFAGFRDAKLDLGGWTYQFTIGMRIGR